MTHTIEFIGRVQLTPEATEYHEITRLGDKLFAHSLFANCGAVKADSFKMDMDFSLDENLQEFIEKLQNQ